jgi:hypothetical protein
MLGVLLEHVRETPPNMRQWSWEKEPALSEAGETQPHH